MRFIVTFLLAMSLPWSPSLFSQNLVTHIHEDSVKFDKIKFVDGKITWNQNYQKYLLNLNGELNSYDVKDYPSAVIVGTKKEFIRYKGDYGFGLASLDKKKILPPVYDHIKPLNGKLFIVKKYEMYGVVNSHNELIQPYNTLRDFYYPYSRNVNIKSLDHGKFEIALKRKSYIYNQDGQQIDVIRDMIFDHEVHYYAGHILINSKGDSLKFGLICDNIEPAFDNLILCSTRRKSNIHSRKGKLLFESSSEIQIFSDFLSTNSSDKTYILNRRGKEMFSLPLCSDVIESDDHIYAKIKGSKIYNKYSKKGKLIEEGLYSKIQYEDFGEILLDTNQVLVVQNSSGSQVLKREDVIYFTYKHEQLLINYNGSSNEIVNTKSGISSSKLKHHLYITNSEYFTVKNRTTRMTSIYQTNGDLCLENAQLLSSKSGLTMVKTETGVGLINRQCDFILDPDNISISSLRRDNTVKQESPQEYYYVVNKQNIHQLLTISVNE